MTSSAASLRLSDSVDLLLELLEEQLSFALWVDDDHISLELLAEAKQY